MRTGGLLVGAACAPIIAHVSALAVNFGPGAWLTLPERTRWSLAPDALLFTTSLAIVCAPVFGVVIAGRCTNSDRASVFGPAMQIGACALLFSVVSALLTLGWLFGQGDALSSVARSHMTLAASATALMAWGALCGGCFRNPLDAAGISLLTTLVATMGLLVSGTIAADLPRSLVNAGLTASPLVAVTSAGQIDLFHSDLLYQISPLAHTQINYPTWTLATACYLAGAGVFMLTFAATGRRMKGLR